MLLKPARKIAATAAVALTAGTFAAFAAPATAAPVTITFVCNTPVGPKEFKAEVSSTLPATLEAGKTATNGIDAKVVLPADVSGLAYGLLSARFADGSATMKTTINDVAAADIPATIPETAIPATGDLTLPAKGAAGSFAPTAAGTYVVKAASFTAKISFKKEDRSEALLVDTTCNPKTVDDNGTPDNPADDKPFVQDLTIHKVTVTAPAAPAKVDSKTTVKAKFAKKKKTITAKVTVKGTDGAAGTGKVKVTLKKGKKKVKTIQAKINAKGAAKAVFKKINKKGKYTVEVEYKGSATQNASKAKATVKVK